MAILLRTLCILPLLFGVAEPFFPFTNPFLFNPFEALNSGFSSQSPPPPPPPPAVAIQAPPVANEVDVVAPDADAKMNYETNFKGSWELVNKNQGVSGMHSALLPNNKIVMYDATSLGPSVLKLNEKLPQNCRLEVNPDVVKKVGKYDCWAHSIEYDIKTGNIRPLKLMTDAWCSSGGLDANGVLVSAGGWFDGGRSIRYFTPCEKNCDWNDKNITLFTGQRWYASQAILPDGSFIVVGGRRMFSYEFVPREGTTQTKNYALPLLDETTEREENNLYPFLHLSTDGNLFIFANNRSILLDYKTNKIVRELPQLQDGPRNYPPSGMSALLPIKLRGKDDPPLIPAEVIICGGSINGSFGLGEKQIYVPALTSCGRIVITDPAARWKIETMPVARVMSDMIILPTGDLLMINGAKRGSSGWRCADEPNLTPHIYRPKRPRGERFIDLAPTTIPRMYHSSSILMPDGKILVTGSNTNDGYRFVKEKYPTELRMEKFTPPYLDPALRQHRPEILEAVSEKKLSYGKQFQLSFKLVNDFGRRMGDINLRMYRPPFTTHGLQFDQRQMLLSLLQVREVSSGNYQVTALAPPSNVIAPPGYYLLFVLHRGVPSTGMWVHVK